MIIGFTTKDLVQDLWRNTV